MIDPTTVEELYEMIEELTGFIEEAEAEVEKDEKQDLVEDYDRAMTII